MFKPLGPLLETRRCRSQHHVITRSKQSKICMYHVSAILMYFFHHRMGSPKILIIGSTSTTAPFFPLSFMISTFRSDLPESHSCFASDACRCQQLHWPHLWRHLHAPACAPARPTERRSAGLAGLALVTSVWLDVSWLGALTIREMCRCS